MAVGKANHCLKGASFSMAVNLICTLTLFWASFNMMVNLIGAPIYSCCMDTLSSI